MTDTANQPTRQCRTLVVGLGSIDRGDDAIGHVVAARIQDAVTAHGPAGVRVVVHDEPTALVEMMAGSDVAVIIDAMRSGARAGTVSVREVGRGRPALPARMAPGSAGTHGFGVAAAIELARALDRLPARVVVVGIEAVDLEHGRPLSAPVARAVPSAVEAILDILRTRATDSPERGPSTSAPPLGRLSARSAVAQSRHA